ncbi:hypothetical protein C8R44DRAFT_439443 [Mycena epipterygia]|nr:hypothetical protein C8R44DRAFT_439443 [Mycena epipterygia]
MFERSLYLTVVIFSIIGAGQPVDAHRQVTNVLASNLHDLPRSANIWRRTRGLDVSLTYCINLSLNLQLAIPGRVSRTLQCAL